LQERDVSAHDMLSLVMAIAMAVMYGPVAAGIFWVLANVKEEKQTENSIVVRVAAKETADLNRELKDAMQKGMYYVSLDFGKDGQPMRTDTMQFFATKPEAQEHNYLRRTADNEYMVAYPIQPLQQQLERRIELQQLTGSPGQEPKDITIDTGRIVFEERARREVFTEEISRQLRERGIQPNLKQLSENITDDKLQFEITGSRREQGVEKPQVIRIEQNEDRAFLIRSIEPQQQQKIMGYMESKVLEGTVRREDALEIKNMLQEEKANGNRFVAFPAEPGGLKKDDLTAFKSSFAALEHAYENSTDRDRYIVRSITVVEKEINHLLENKKELEKPKENEREDKRSRGQEISR